MRVSRGGAWDPVPLENRKSIRFLSKTGLENYNFSLKPLFCLFLNGRLRQVLLCFQILFSDPLLPAATVTDIPKDGNLRHFSEQQMVTIFRLLNVREDTVHRLFNNKIDGKRFSMFTDKDLQTLGILNPIIRYFRDRSNPPPKKLQKFML